MINKGLIYILTGDGKGKTTAAFGLAMRAAGYKLRSLIVQFIKDKSKSSGEVKFLSQKANSQQLIANRIDIYTMGAGFVGILGDKKPKKIHEQKTQEAFALMMKKLQQKKYSLVILDEINVAIDLGLIDADEIIKFLKSKPKDLNVVLTGRNAHKKIIELADMVSEIKNIKHPFDKGNRAQKGIDF